MTAFLSSTERSLLDISYKALVNTDGDPTKRSGTTMSNAELIEMILDNTEQSAHRAKKEHRQLGAHAKYLERIYEDEPLVEWVAKTSDTEADVLKKAVELSTEIKKHNAIGMGAFLIAYQNPVLSEEMGLPTKTDAVLTRATELAREIQQSMKIGDTEQAYQKMRSLCEVTGHTFLNAAKHQYIGQLIEQANFEDLSTYSPIIRDELYCLKENLIEVTSQHVSRWEGLGQKIQKTVEYLLKKFPDEDFQLTHLVQDKDLENIQLNYLFGDKNELIAELMSDTSDTLNNNQKLKKALFQWLETYEDSSFSEWIRDKKYIPNRLESILGTFTLAGMIPAGFGALNSDPQALTGLCVGAALILALKIRNNRQRDAFFEAHHRGGPQSEFSSLSIATGIQRMLFKLLD